MIIMLGVEDFEKLEVFVLGYRERLMSMIESMRICDIVN